MARKMTLLEMTQNILSAMNSDEVSSISDTVESLQVAQEIQTTYEEMFSNRDIPELEGLVNLEWAGDADRPHALTLPNNIGRIKWIQYRNFRSNNLDFKRLDYLSPEEFVQRIVEQPTSNFGEYQTVKLLDTSPIEYNIAVDKTPSFYTVFTNDNTILLDAFDAAYESHVTGSNVLAWGIQNSDFELADEYIPPIDANLFPGFLAEAKSACFLNVKEVANAKEENRARRQKVRSQTRLHKTNGQRQGAFDSVDYGRKR